MEKFSAYRDPGTGIQPFLTPVSPHSLSNVFLPLRVIIGILRSTLILVLFLLYLLLVPPLSFLLAPIPLLSNVIEHLLTFVIGRTILLIIGLFRIPVLPATRKRTRLSNSPEKWNPRAGDIIVSNWVSWIELVWLAVRFNPLFVLPVPEATPAPSLPSTPISHSPGRRTGTGSANIQQPTNTPSLRIPIRAFRKVSLLQMIRFTGHVPSPDSDSSRLHSLEDIRKSASKPIVVFPECTTSNGRGLLRFADVFRQNVPVNAFRVFVMCVRYDPPTTLAPTLAHSIPSNIMNPLPHLFSLTTSLSPLAISIRLLAPSESPSSPFFIASEVVTGAPQQDQLTECCASLIAHIGKIKQTGMGWEDKVKLLQLHRAKMRS